MVGTGKPDEATVCTTLRRMTFRGTPSLSILSSLMRTSSCETWNLQEVVWAKVTPSGPSTLSAVRRLVAYKAGRKSEQGITGFIAMDTHSSRPGRRAPPACIPVSTQYNSNPIRLFLLPLLSAFTSYRVGIPMRELAYIANTESRVIPFGCSDVCMLEDENV